MNIDTKQIIEYWKSHAEYDIETAEAMCESKRYPYCLFMTHQAIEKLLKARIVKISGTHAPYGHNLLRFAELSQLSFSKQQLELFAEITEFNIKARYDDYQSQFYKKCTQEYTEKYLALGKEIYLWIKQHLDEN